MSKYKPEVGDRVRVSFEAEVQQVYSDGDLRFSLVDYYDTEIPHEGDFSIEKVEPPVVTFKPGDVVREKDRSRGTAPISLGRDGFINHSDGAFLRYGQSEFYLRLDQFTSERFEKVEL